LGVLIFDRARAGPARQPLNVSLDHAQVLAPSGGVEEAHRFYRDVVGLEPIERPSTMGGAGAWFAAGEQQLHISEEEGFVPATRAHPAFGLDGAGLDALAGRLEAAGAEVRWDERLPGARRFYTFDPAGNRLEFLARAPAS
jgi:catechol 2,3-dioxygenase-like lactoylglutathione lyase family enzyme